MSNSRSISRRRGTAEQHEGFVGANAEITVDTTNKRLMVHDGETEGGFPQATEEYVDDKASLSAVSVSLFGAVGDGVVDDSPAFQATIDYAKENGINKITAPKKTYRLNSILHIDYSDIEIDLHGSEVHNYAESTKNRAGVIGLFNFRGDMPGGDIVEYCREQRSGVHAPQDAPVLESIEPYIEIKSLSLITGSKLVTSNNQYFDEGDFVIIRGYTRDSTPYDENFFEPEIGTVARVIGVELSHVIVDHYVPIDYQAFLNTSNTKSRVIKTIPIKNTSLKNVRFVDKTSVSEVGNPTGTEVQNVVSMVSTILVDNVSIHNVSTKDHRATSILPRFCRNIQMTNISAENARQYNIGGQGYLTHILFSNRIKVNKPIGTKCRHVLDFSWSSYAEVYDGEAFDGHARDWDMHGLCEHDIQFIRCKGTLQLGNGITSFPNIVKNVFFDNCDLKLPPRTSGTGTQSFFRDNITFKNSRVYTDMFPIPYINVEFDNCKIFWDGQESAQSLATRDTGIPTSSIIKKKSVVEIDRESETSTLNIYAPAGVDEFEICDTKFKLTPQAEVNVGRLRFTFLNNPSIIIDNNEFKNLFFRVLSNVEKQMIKTTSNTIEIEKDTIDHMLLFDSAENANIFAEIEENTAIHKGSVAQFFPIHAGSVVETGTVHITARVLGNTFIGNANAPVHYSYSDNYDFFDSGNIVNPLSSSPSQKWNASRNLLIS